jgi:hypothetical protein
MALRITGVLDFVHRPEFYIPKKGMLWKLDLFPSSGKGRDTPTLLGPLERANPNPVSETLCFLVFRILDDRQRPEAQ